jgi:hypothetical protein
MLLLLQAYNFQTELDFLKHSWSPRIDSNESIPPAYVVAGLALKTPPKKTHPKKPKKTHLKKPTKNVFFWVFKIFNFF